MYNKMKHCKQSKHMKKYGRYYTFIILFILISWLLYVITKPVRENLCICTGMDTAVCADREELKNKYNSGVNEYSDFGNFVLGN